MSIFLSNKCSNIASSNQQKILNMKTIKENNFRKLNSNELSETKGGFWMKVILPDGTERRIWI